MMLDCPLEGKAVLKSWATNALLRLPGPYWMLFEKPFPARRGYIFEPFSRTLIGLLVNAT
jgi:hypothetical protein